MAHTDDQSVSSAEQFAQRVASRAYGPTPEDGYTNTAGVGSGDYVALVELIIQAILGLLDNCPNRSNHGKILATVRNPTIFARARFRRLVKSCCDECWTIKWQGESGVISQAIMEEAKAADDSELLAVLFDVEHEDWLLI